MKDIMAKRERLAARRWYPCKSNSCQSGHSSHNCELIVGRQFASIENSHYIPHIDVEGLPLKPLKDNYHGS